MDFIVLYIFPIVRVLWIPFLILGIIIVFTKRLYASKKLGISATAIEVLNGRWTMHVFGLRKDAVAVKLSRVLPSNSLFGLWIILLPRYIRYRINGSTKGYPKPPSPGKEHILHIIIARTFYFDKIIERSKNQVNQFVILGAGFDTRCYGPLQGSSLRLFELDRERILKLKLKYLRKAGIDTSGVNYISVDFSTEHWYEKLEAAGYDPTKKSIFLWEGVTLYLPESDVRKTLQELKEHAAPNSVVIADIYAQSFIKGEYSRIVKTYRRTLNITNEGFRFGLDFAANHQETLKTFVESEQMELGEACFMGHKRKPKAGPYMVVAEIIV